MTVQHHQHACVNSLGYGASTSATSQLGYACDTCVLSLAVLAFFDALEINGLAAALEDVVAVCGVFLRLRVVLVVQLVDVVAAHLGPAVFCHVVYCGTPANTTKVPVHSWFGVKSNGECITLHLGPLYPLGCPLSHDTLH